MLNMRNEDANDSVNDRLNDSVNDSVRITCMIIDSNPGIQRKGISNLSDKRAGPSNLPPAANRSTWRSMASPTTVASTAN